MPKSNPFWSARPAGSQRSRSLMRHVSGLLRDKRGRFEDWIEAPLVPPILGCGYWGCTVLAGHGDRLLKLTVDPAEPKLAMLIGELQREDSARGEMARGGIVKIHKVARIRGNRWRYRGDHPIYAIVREAVIPVQEASSQSRSDPLAAWLRRRRGKKKEEARTLLQEQLEQNMTDIELDGETFTRPPGWVSQQTMYLLDEIVETLERADRRKTARGRARQEAQAISMMAQLASYPEGENIGEAMLALIAGFDVPLRDVHVGNIGLRTEQTFAGVNVPALVLYDFGHDELRRIPDRQVPHLRI